MYNENIELKTEIKVVKNIINKKLNQLNKSENINVDKENTQETYASKLKKATKIKEQTHKIIIKHKQINDSEKTKSEIKKTVDPIKNKIGISGIRKIKDGKVDPHIRRY